MQFDPSAPIWLQLVDEFVRRIVTGRWPSGEKIPAVRELAAEHRDTGAYRESLHYMMRAGMIPADLLDDVKEVLK